MPIHITLSKPVKLGDPDALGRTYFGWDPGKSDEDNWLANRADWVLGERALKERYALFTDHATRTIKMAVEINRIDESPNVPGKKVIEGTLLGPGHPVHDTFVGKEQPSSTRVRNPVTYLDAAIGGWPCACGCGTEIYSGEFVRGHEQTALHQRVAQIGTIAQFLRWFDAIQAGDAPTTTAPTTITADGRLELLLLPDGGTTLSFTPTTAS